MVDAAGFDSYFYRFMVGYQQIQTQDGGSAYKPGYPENSYKMGDYVCIILLGAVLGKAIGEPLGIPYSTISVCCMLIACYCELESVISNYCECKGLHYHISLWSVFKGLVGMKSKELKDVINEIENESKHENLN